MNWLHTTAMVFHVLLAAGIVGLVLLQRGRGADAGAGFGAGASGTVFGARGSASFLSRTTATLAALFFVTSLSLAYMGGQRQAPQSVIDKVTPPTVPEPSTDIGQQLPALEEMPVPAGSSVSDSTEAPAAPAMPSEAESDTEQPSQ